MADFTVHINVTQLPQREDENGSFNVNDNLNARSIVRGQVNQFIQDARRLFSSRTRAMQLSQLHDTKAL